MSNTTRQPGIERAKALVQLFDKEDQDLLRKASVFRYVTNGLAAKVVGSDKNVSRLLENPILQVVNPGTDESVVKVWEIPIEVRQHLLNEDDSDCADLRNEIAANLPKSGQTLQELLAQLSAPQFAAEARKSLEKQFDEALAQPRPEIARAHDLSQLLNEWPVNLDEDSGDLFQRLAARLYRYTRAVRDYEATGMYLRRDFEEKSIKLLLDDPQQWIMQLYAPGGRGKTMFQRHLLGRYCPQNDIPVARIDFDYLEHIATCMAQPWRILLTIASQLNEQLVSQPFTHMLESRRMFRAPLSSDPLGVNRNLALSEEWLDQRFAEDTPNKFRKELKRAVGDGTVLIVLDTFENVLHMPNASLMPILEMLDDVRVGPDGDSQDSVPGLRVILCGRFDLTSEKTVSEATVDRLEGFRKAFWGIEPETAEDTTESRDEAEPENGTLIKHGKSMISVELKDFLKDESEEFLTTKCGRPDDDVTAAVIERCHAPDDYGILRANPMKLALLFEHIRENPGVSAKQILAFESVEFFYLTNRVVDRIGDGRIQWLLRWGVLPCILTKELVHNVLWPELVRYVRDKDHEYDNPETDNIEKSDSEANSERWRLLQLDEVEGDSNFENTWNGLLDYASGASWVSHVEEMPDAVTFHDEIRDPLRNLLRKKNSPVFHDIHQKAYEFFQTGSGIPQAMN